MKKILFFFGITILSTALFFTKKAYCQDDFESGMKSINYKQIYKSDSTEIYYKLYHYKNRYYLFIAHKNHYNLAENIIISTKKDNYYFFPMNFSGDDSWKEYHFPVIGFLIYSDNYKKIIKEQIAGFYIMFRTNYNNNEVNYYGIIDVEINDFEETIIDSQPY